MTARSPGFALAPALALVAGLSLACTTPGGPPRPAAWNFHAPAGPDDVFYGKIASWQAREIVDRGPDIFEFSEEWANSDAVDPDWELRIKFDRFLGAEKRTMARSFTKWAQRQSLFHYKEDPYSTLADDQWPTTRELFDTNGDDCDGMDLIAYNLLREAGFSQDELWRLIIRRESDGANHMVTLWFEDAQDPWLIDATGALSRTMIRFSDLPKGWTPRVMFREDAIFNVVAEDGHSGRFARKP